MTLTTIPSPGPVNVNQYNWDAQTPDRLRAFVESRGGSITRVSDYRYTPEQGGDGERGVVRVSFADSSGQEVGQISFMRRMGQSGSVAFDAVDFTDRLRDTSGWIHRKKADFHTMLSAVDAGAPTDVSN